jgi:hypothetical protein
MKMRAILFLIIVFSAPCLDAIASSMRVCSNVECRSEVLNGRISVNASKNGGSGKRMPLDWNLLNLKQPVQQNVVSAGAIQITQADVSQLAADGNSWVVFGGAEDNMPMNIGTANNASPQTWALPSDFQEYFDYYTQDDFISPSKVPVALRFTGATHVTKSVYIDDNNAEFEVYEHYKLSSNKVDHLGRSFDFDISNDAFDEPDYEFMKVPLSLGNVISSTMEEYDYRKKQILFKTVTTLTIDAYGTITIPNYGTFNCLRGYYQTQFYTRPDTTSAYVLKETRNSIAFMTKEGHFFQAKIVSQTGSNAILGNLSFKAIVPTALLSETSEVRINNDSKGVSINNYNTAAHHSAVLDVDNDSLGILIPRIYMENRPSDPAMGLLIYQMDETPGFYYYDGDEWQRLNSVSDPNARVSAVSKQKKTVGSAQLQDGTAFIRFENPRDDFEDLMLNIQLEGDCKGIYVSRKTREGFEVKEIQKGKSNVKFSWSLN